MGSAPRKGRNRHCISIVLLCLGLLAGCGHGDVRPASTPRAARIADEGPGPGAGPGNADAANAVLMRAISLVGTPYRYGGNTPEGGFDCSGLVAYVFRDVLDLRLPRSSRELAGVQGPPIAPDRLASADLVFFGTQEAVSHVGIY
ncbi:MAG TPA: C40 family peptidase, partial [Xanthomonadaceae bacterium]|nr:C40 family peptidase [Xanthomonadaceae bacterium]